MAKVKFPSEMPSANNIGGNDKMMIAKEGTGETYQATFDQAKQYLTISSIEMQPVAPGALPAGPTGETRYMVVRTVGTWTYGGVDVGSNADGYETTFWWNGDSWENNGSVRIKGEPGETPSGTDTLQAEEIPKGKAVSEYVEPLFELTKSSKNLINYKRFVGGVYVISGTDVVFQENANWVSVAITSGFEVGESYYYSGYSSNITGTVVLVVFADINNKSLGYVLKDNATSSFTIPANTYYIYLRVANGVDIGLNPTMVAQKDTAMLAKGTSASTFEPYSFSLDAEKIAGIQPEVQNQIDNVSNVVNEITIMGNQLIDNSAMLAGSYNLSGVPSTSVNWIRTPLIKLDKTKENVTISGYGTVPTSVARIIFFNESLTYISHVLSPASGTSGFVTAPIPSNAEYVAFNVANVVGIGNDPTNSPYKDTVIANYGSEPLPFEPYSSEAFVNGEKIKGLVIPNNYPNSFYEYNPTGNGGYPRMTVYSKLKGSQDLYVGYNIDNFYDMSELVYSNQYRITGAQLYRYSSGIMTYQGRDMITVGESESVYMVTGKADHTGGYHGDEIFEIINFYANGVQVATDEAIELTPCNDFYYSQKSTMHETADSGNIVIPTHPVQAIHYKHTYFIDGGYTTKNRLVWQQAGIPVAYWYVGIACIGKATGQYVENELLERITVNADENQKLSVVGLKELTSFHSVNKLSSLATSTLTMPSDKDSTCRVFFADRANDNKYYRRFNPTSSPVVGEVWESVMDVRFGIVVLPNP